MLERVVVTGGGSAGHVIPTIPVIEALIRRDVEVHFIGSRSGFEERLVAPLGVTYHGVSTGKLRRYLSIQNLADLVRIPLGVLEAWRLIGRIRPDVIFSKGGFVCFPAAVGGWCRGVPVVGHESDLTPGLATRLTKPFAKMICTTFADTRIEGVTTRVTGTPIRAALEQGRRADGLRLLNFAGDKPVLLVVGGSLGATAINAAVIESLDVLLQRFDVVHVCGEGKLDPRAEGRAGYVQREFFSSNWGDVIAAADVVVSRAGAGSLYEWVALSKPHVLIPLPKEASRGDQVENAEYAERRQISYVLPQDAVSPSTLIEAIDHVLGHAAEYRAAMAHHHVPDSVGSIIAALEEAIGD